MKRSKYIDHTLLKAEAEKTDIERLFLLGAHLRRNSEKRGCRCMHRRRVSAGRDEHKS